MIKLCSSTQISSVHYSLFRPPGLNTCISLVNRKEPLIWMNSGMNLGGRIASPQVLILFLLSVHHHDAHRIRSASYNAHLSQWSPAQCSVCSGARQGVQLGMGWGCCAVAPFLFPEARVLSCLYALGHCPRPFNCMG